MILFSLVVVHAKYLGWESIRSFRESCLLSLLHQPCSIHIYIQLVYNQISCRIFCWLDVLGATHPFFLDFKHYTTIIMFFFALWTRYHVYTEEDYNEKDLCIMYRKIYLRNFLFVRLSCQTRKWFVVLRILILSALWFFAANSCHCSQNFRFPEMLMLEVKY